MEIFDLIVKQMYLIGATWAQIEQLGTWQVEKCRPSPLFLFQKGILPIENLATRLLSQSRR